MTRRDSAFGMYEGWSTEAYDGFDRRSFHLPMADGVRLAVDVFLPTRGGRLGDTPVPVVFQMTPYNRAQVVDGVLTHVLSPYVDAQGGEHLNNLAALSRHGYGIVVADVRGQGASFGAYTGVMTEEEGRDGAEIVDWIAAQPWCSGAVGMLGSSYGASTQFLTAVHRPPALKALYACHSYFDAFDVHFPGGVRELSLPVRWSRMVDDLAGRTAPSVVAPVDGPDGPALLEEALAEHRATPGATAVFARICAEATRDGVGYFDRRTAMGSQNLATLLPELQAAAIPAYHHGGWNDYFPDQTARWFVNWTTAPAKLVIGPWTHSPRTFSSPRDDEDLRIRFTESLRWFDQWLKGVDNGVLDEPPVHFAVQDSHPYREGDGLPADRWSWRSSQRWPLDSSRELTLYLAGGPSGSVASVNDGLLLNAAPPIPLMAAVRVDTSTTTGPHNRMGSSFAGLPLRFPEMSSHDARALTWTTPPLAEDLVLGGTPVLELVVGSDAADPALIVWLEDVDDQGRSTLITYGALQASHRAVAPFTEASAGAVVHVSTSSAVEAASALNDEPAHVEISLLPTATRFQRGHSLRLTLSGADEGNLEGAPADKSLCVHIAPSLPGRLRLAILPERET